MQAKQPRQTKGKIGNVRISRGPRKGKVVRARIYPNGSWSEIKNGRTTGRVHSASSGSRSKYSARSLQARGLRVKAGKTFGHNHRANVRTNNQLLRTKPAAAVPGSKIRNVSPPSKNRGKRVRSRTRRRRSR